MMEVGLTYDDLLIVPKYSEILPKDSILRTQVTKKLFLNIPIISSAMDTVTEYEMAISMAKQGGMGVIHRNLSIDEQREQVRKVKRASSAFIDDPITISEDLMLEDILSLKKKHSISTFLVLNSKYELIGIVTNRDMKCHDFKKPVSEIMSKKLVVGEEGLSIEEAETIMLENRIEKLPIISKDKKELKGLFCIKDIDAMINYPNSIVDGDGRYLVGAAIGTSDKDKERVEALVDVDVDVVVVDTAHGHHKKVFDMIRYIKDKYPDVEVMAGNVATVEGAQFLIDAGADAIKVGIGPGSICTTRVVSGVGYPQASAVKNVAEKCLSMGVPVIADGGIKYSGDISKAIGLGASAVMLGSLIAGVEEAPGEIIFTKGKRYKSYRGMGSLSAMKEGSKDRYYQGDIQDEKLVPEGVEAGVEILGRLENVSFQLLGGLRSTMGYCGALTIDEYRSRVEFVKITNAGLKESHVHDVTILRESPNYQL